MFLSNKNSENFKTYYFKNWLSFSKNGNKHTHHQLTHQVNLHVDIFGNL